MKDQKLTITLEMLESGEMNIGLNFDPAIAGEKSKELEHMTEDEKMLQNYAQHIACAVMDSLKKLQE